MNENRTEWEAPRHLDKKAYQLRKQEERESKWALEDFRRHYNEEYNGEPDRLDEF